MKDALEHEYPGIGRLHYFLAHIAMIAVVVLVVTTFGPESPVMSFTTVALMIASFVLDVMRLQNIGLSQWFAFLRYVPFGKTILGISLLCAQPGWAESRRLDSAGKSILAVEIGLLVLVIFLAYRTGMTIFGIGDLNFLTF